MVLSQRSEICNTQAAPRASNVCFGDNAALGMKAFTQSAAPALAAPHFLLVFFGLSASFSSRFS
jgi:hypothetical protein